MRVRIQRAPVARGAQRSVKHRTARGGERRLPQGVQPRGQYSATVLAWYTVHKISNIFINFVVSWIFKTNNIFWIFSPYQ